MTSLNFKGKSAVWNHHLSVPFHTLEEDKKLSLKGDNADENLIIEGDNLIALKALLPKYQGKVKCIYIDPPYNTGNEEWKYNDKVNAPQIKEWYKTTVGKEGEDLTRHDKWLSMMTPRLKMLRELLSTDGVIFVSIDDNEQHHLRQIMDEMFGSDNFVSCIIWQKKYAVQSDSKWFSTNHDYIIVYAKNKDLWYPNLLQRNEEQLEKYKNPDNDPRGLWQSVVYTCNKTKTERPNLYYPVKNPITGIETLPNENRVWGYEQSTYQQHIKENRLWWGANGELEKPRLKSYLSEVNMGIVPSTLWLRSEVGDTQAAKREIMEIFGNSVFETPKPTSLVTHILKLSTDKDSIVLDSFAGSGTTAHAVMEQNKEDGGNRKFILVEMEDYANSITAERVRRVVKRDEYKAGFTYYKLGPSIDAETMLAGELPEYKQFAKYVYYLATGKDHPDEKSIDEAKYFVGQAEHDSIYLVYKKDLEELKSLAITLDWAEKTQRKDSGRKIVYAPACYLDEEALDKYQIKFVSIPYNLFERNEI